MMYRKPILSIRDRHVLVELDMDKHDEYDVRHLLNHAYLNHKSPHEYDDLKRFIRDITLGKHNSVYIMNNGNPNPLASAFVLGSPYLTRSVPIGTLYYDYLVYYTGSICTYWNENLTNNSSNCNSSSSPISSAGLNTYGYNNGTAIVYGILYSPIQFSKIAPSYPNTVFIVAPTAVFHYYPQFYPKYGYAPYISSQNPLTLTAYLMWENSSSNTYNENYVYFAVPFYYSQAYYCPDYMGNFATPAVVPLFYSSGNFNFSTSNYYISMWQWVYQ